MHRVRTKICGITRIEDAQAAISAGADALGFVFYKGSPRFISSARAQTIISQLPPFPARVGLFVNPASEFVSSVLGSVSLDVVQFHGDEEAGFCGSFDKPYIKAIRMKDGVDLTAVFERYNDAAALLLDSYSEQAHGGTGISFDWNKIPGDLSRPIILAGGLTPENVRQAVEKIRPYAVDVSSGVEFDAGIKDKNKIAAFIKEVSNV